MFKRQEISSLDEIKLPTLQKHGYAGWYRKVSSESYAVDPWEAYKLVLATSSSGCLGTLQNLFIKHCSISESEFFDVFSEQEREWLIQNEIVQETEKRWSSKYCLLVCFGFYLFVDWPEKSSNEKLVSSQTYLSSSSFDCIHSIKKYSASNDLFNTLDVGCGSGLILLQLSKISEKVFGIDIDTEAVKLSRINLELNGAKASLVNSDVADYLFKKAGFDLINVNPTWRIVPEGVNYPNPIARVGVGNDGLDYVRYLLKALPSLLSNAGKMLLRVDIPLSEGAKEERYFDLKRYLPPQYRFKMYPLKKVSASQQCRVSADTCSYLNPEIDLSDLVRVFETKYRQLNISGLQEIECVITLK
ncbi:methyltransferase domain-containing protein [Kordiimonas sp. SCSIO 12603]|uniref:methyltransferase domain-containing protein n=1 Tax=Kordiimonas sp. SCSIO 12603 TaxID=2829596 RepID=UPI0021057F00|nr:methyltransferase domain-containing protein [Kordiimonas sp. SCSIO 12603]UTW59519.1 methyltransferase domain-containing protein [Kordiimonas sp. SCSIO 12603]